MTLLIHKRIVLGVSGGIAAYKSAELVRRLRERGAEVRVVMTRAAQNFIGPLTLQALSAHPVHTELLDPDTESSMGHIELARWADLVMIAPASANVLARLAHGFADELLTALCLATSAPITVAPAMNQQMWQAEATQANIALLRQRGVRCLGPAVGSQACGETGPGRMLAPEDIVAQLLGPVHPGLLEGIKVMITAGPTREAIDPVRFISNRSSGKMGYALAQAAAEQGAQVTLVSGPVQLAPPPGVNRLAINSAAEMYATVMDNIAGQAIFIGAAAVADYRSAEPARQKLKKTDQGMMLVLTPNPDILAAVTALPRPPFAVGFAAETERLAAHAREKLARKRLDMIVGNLVNEPGIGFDSDDNILQIFWQTGDINLERASKLHLARKLIVMISEHWHAKNTAQDPGLASRQ